MPDLTERRLRRRTIDIGKGSERPSNYQVRSEGVNKNINSPNSPDFHYNKIRAKVEGLSKNRNILRTSYNGGH